MCVLVISWICNSIFLLSHPIADKMLDMGFERQVNSILENIRPDRQTLLLSATFGKRVEKVARGWLRNPVRYVSRRGVLS
jgi:superfamily II DNA/RNA helicase